MKIAVVGAGTGGLAAAALLADPGHKVTLVARFAAPPAQDQHRLVSATQTLGRFDLGIDAAGAGSRLSPLVARRRGFGAILGSCGVPSGSVLPQDHLTRRYFRAARMAGVLPVGRLAGEDMPLAGVALA